MNGALHPSLLALDDCGCCEGVTQQTPQSIFNNPGLSRIAYRVGTHSKFRASLLSALSNLSYPELAALSGLTTREEDDFSIALVDAWACVADVLTFYQERLANEFYLRTATERFSILELARLIGYELRPGVAAAVRLAFTMDNTPGSPQKVQLDPGLKVQSIPGPGETAQTFETIEGIEARPDWNDIKPQMNWLRYPQANDTHVYLQGTGTNLKPGDGLLFVGSDRQGNPYSEGWDFRRVTSVEPDSDADRTRVEWAKGLGAPAPKPSWLAADVKIYAFRQRVGLFGGNAPDWRTMADVVRKQYDSPNGTASDWPNFNIAYAGSVPTSLDTIYLDSVYSQIAVGSWVVLSQPAYRELYRVVDIKEASAAQFTLTGKATRLKLSGPRLASEFGSKLRETLVFAQSDKLTLAQEPLTNLPPNSPSADLPLEPGLVAPVEGNLVPLAHLVSGLAKGQEIGIGGKRIRVRLTPGAGRLNLTMADGSPGQDLAQEESLRVMEPPQKLSAGNVRWHLRRDNGFDGFLPAVPHDALVLAAAKKDDEMIGELAIIDLVEPNPVNGAPLQITLKSLNPAVAVLRNIYDRKTVSISANVAQATHGETGSEEILGGGDATQVFQAFTLKQPPLTYLRSPLPPGFASSLEEPGRGGVRVNNVRWHEVPTLYGHGPAERVYTARRNDDGKTMIRFGDGFTGARLPTGIDNVRAIYRKGIGVAGNVRAGQLTNLLSRPLGLKAATNPQDAEGGADPEALADARTNAPLQVLTLNRVVSLQDYEDFARAYPGIAKALATWTWDGRSKGVLLTVAGPGGVVIDEGGEVAIKLRDLLSAAGEPFVAVRIKPHQTAAFRLGGGLFVDPDYDPQQVLVAVQASLAEAFSFEVRAFGQPAMLSEAMAAIQSIAGVIGVDVERFYRTELAPDRKERLLAALPGSGANNPGGAELLTLAAGGADDLRVSA